MLCFSCHKDTLPVWQHNLGDIYTVQINNKTRKTYLEENKTNFQQRYLSTLNIRP